MTTLRPATPTDAPRLTEIALSAKVHWGYDDAFMEAARPELTMTPELVERWRTVVGERDGEVVGFCSLSLDEDAEPEVEMIFVDPAAIGGGVGGLLLREGLDAAWAAGAQSVLVESDPNAEPFYAALGGVRVGERRSASTGRLLPLLRFARP